MKVVIFRTNHLTEHNAASNLVNGPLKHLVKFKDLEIRLIAPNNIRQAFTIFEVDIHV